MKRTLNWELQFDCLSFPRHFCRVFVTSLGFGDLLFIYLPTCLPVCSLSLYFDF